MLIDDPVLDHVLDVWTLQDVAGFNGCVSPQLDEYLSDSRIRDLVSAGLHCVCDRLDDVGVVEPDVGELRVRAEPVRAGGSWRMPWALSAWVKEVVLALSELTEGRFPAPPAGQSWIVNGDGRHFWGRAGT
jgi:hypothetical protein